MHVQTSLRSIILASSIATLLTLSACGQRGPLYLPKRPPKPPDAASVNANPADRVDPGSKPEDVRSKNRNAGSAGTSNTPNTRQDDTPPASDSKAGPAGTQTRQ